MNVKISVLVIFIEAIIYLLLYSFPDRKFDLESCMQMQIYADLFEILVASQLYMYTRRFVRFGTIYVI